MNEQRTLIVGMDLSEDYIQLCYFNHQTFDVTPISATSKTNEFLIPTILGVAEDTKEWVLGREAFDLVKENRGILIDRVLERVKAGNGALVYGAITEPVLLMEKLLRKVLLLLKRDFPVDTIRFLTISVDCLDINYIQVLYQALEMLGLYKDRVRIQSSQCSFMYYALSQKRELWMNDVALFDFSEKGLCYYQLSINRKCRPMAVSLAKQDFSDTVSFDMVKQKDENLAYVFNNLAGTAMFKKIISTVYLVGAGFDGEWLNEALPELCKGRRVFKGRNLYAYGACYHAREMVEQNKLREYVFLSDEMLSVAVAMDIYEDAKMQEMACVMPGTPWYEVGQEFDVILDDTNEIDMQVYDILTRESQRVKIVMENMRKRENKMTRVRIRIQCIDRNTMVITAKDLGFGDYVKRSNRIFEQIVMIR